MKQRLDYPAGRYRQLKGEVHCSAVSLQKSLDRQPGTLTCPGWYLVLVLILVLILVLVLVLVLALALALDLIPVPVPVPVLVPILVLGQRPMPCSRRGWFLKYCVPR
ncbi:hypothetical protein LX36DRAFT_656704 [Colletotrichum falcatum]|nr:hypothetical protein LX36DRAFT_656704 [Colletotrichum falcatum]